MCYSAPSSLLAWGFANAIAVYLWHRNRRYDRWNAAFIFTFTLIQLLEAGLWSSSSPNTNQVLTGLMVVALLAQPLVQSYMGWRYTREGILRILTFVYLGLLIWGIYKVVSRPENFSSHVGPRGHLVWESKGEGHLLQPFTWLYLAGLFIPLLYMGTSGIPLIIIGIATFVYSWIKTRGQE